MGGCIPHGPDFLVHILSPSALHLGLGSSVQFSNLDLCLYLHPSPDEGSMVIYKICISVAMGEGQFRLSKDLAGEIPLDTWEPL